jgi:hypothetical protein
MQTKSNALAWILCLVLFALFISETEVTGQEALLINYARSGKAGDLIGVELKNGETLRPGVQIFVNSSKFEGALPFKPNVNFENKDGRIIDHLQQRHVELSVGSVVNYLNLESFGILEPPVLYVVVSLSPNADKSVKIVLKLGDVVKRWN